MNKAVFLEGDRVYLRPVELEDLDKFYQWFNDFETTQFLYIYYPITRSEEKNFIENIGKTENTVTLAIVKKSKDVLIGNTSLMNIDIIHRKADLGIAIGDKSILSKGYGTEAMTLIIDYGFKTLNLHRIELCVNIENIGAIKAYHKVGFEEEGRKRESFYSGGNYHDMLQMSILKQDWLKKGRR